MKKMYKTTSRIIDCLAFINAVTFHSRVHRTI